MSDEADNQLVPLWTIGDGGQVTISGTTFTQGSGRLAGTPSKLFPPLRDLAIDPVVKLRGGEVKPTITVEIDTQHARKTGVIKSYSKSGTEETVYLRIERESALHPGESRYSTEPIRFTSILAFRLLKVEIPEGAI